MQGFHLLQQSEVFIFHKESSKLVNYSTTCFEAVLVLLYVQGKALGENLQE
jgi:hypothetical protein